jgi:putative PEP-CTERM system TPR-repeat lipoprotein
LAHLAQGDMNTAFGELEQISSADKGTTADLALIAAYLRRNEADKALKAIDVLEKKQPDNPSTHNLRAGALLAKKDVVGARKSFEKALAVSPTYFPAAMSLARMDMADKKPEEARKRFEAILAVDPKNSAAMLALADLRAASGSTPAEVTELLNKAVSANPTDVAPRLALINFYLRSKESKKAVTAAQDALAALPDKPDILDALARAQAAAGDLNQALAAYGKLATLQPASPVPLLRMAGIHVANKNKEEAIKSLRKALEIKPDLLDAQRGLILIALESQKPENALAIAREIQKQRPKEATGFALEGDIQAASRHWPEATSAYRSALKLAAAPELAIKLHTVYLATKNKTEADRTATAWLKDHPKDIAFRLHMGDVALAGKDYTTAAQYFRDTVDIQPNNPLALNNLAWVSGKLKSPKAIEYAEKANQLAPNQPAFMDTLAMLMAAKGDTAGAITLLRKAVEIAPQAATIRFNLAKLLVSAGRKDEARAELDTLAKLGDKFPGQADVTSLQKEL